MHDTSAVLILSTNKKSDLVETLFNLGYVPLVRQTILPALEMLRHHRFRAVFIDRNREDVDALEFILNVRDLDEKIPIFVIKNAHDQQETRMIARQKNVLLLSGANELRHLESEVH